MRGSVPDVRRSVPKDVVATVSHERALIRDTETTEASPSFVDVRRAQSVRS